MRPRALLTVLSCGIAATLAGCIAPPPMPPEYTPPAPGLVVTYAEAAKGRGDGKTATTRHRIVRNIDDRVLNVVTNLSSGAERHNRTLRGVVTYQIWEPGRGVIVEDIRKNPPRDLWPMTPGNWSVTEGPIFVGEGKTEKAALKKVRRIGSIAHTFQILRRETIRVPAGSFESYVILRKSTVRKADGTLRLTSEKTYWYVPSLGWIVRLDTVTKRPGQPDRKARMVAISITRPAAAK